MLEAKLQVVKVFESSSVVEGITGEGDDGNGKMGSLSELLLRLGDRAPGHDGR